MDEIDAMKAISDKLEKLSNEERNRVLSWAVAKFASEDQTLPFSGPSVAGKLPLENKASPKPASKQKSSKKSKSIIGMDKSLNLSPSGKQSAAQFSAEKSPVNVKQKCVVAVYYLRDVIELQKISVSAVYTFFKTLGWPLPSDLKNTLQQAGTEGWLDTGDSEDIKLTSMGENLVEHSLPPKKAT